MLRIVGEFVSKLCIFVTLNKTFEKTMNCLKKKRIVLTFSLSLAMTLTNAAVTLPKIISSDMIVQRNQPVKIWGKADPGETVSVNAKRTDKGKKYKSNAVTSADADGNWIVELPAMPEGGEYEIGINDIVLTNVLSGDVFLCSGQSNMELPVARVTDMFADEIAEYNNPKIRQFNVPSVVEFHQPLDDVPYGSWKEINQENVMQFSALAYFFAKDLFDRTGVPVGIVNSSWGGTPVESWIREEYLQDYPLAISQKRLYEDDGYRDRIKKLEGENYARWNSVLNANDPGCNSEVKWTSPELDDSGWQEIDFMERQWASDGLNPLNGSHWFRKNVDLPASVEGKPATLRMGCIVDADSVFVNGVFVGNVTYQYPPRIYKVPAGVLKPGNNNVTVRLISQNGFPQFVPEKPYKLIFDDAEYSLEGKWRYHTGAVMPNGPASEFWCYKPTVLYNAMIHPFINCNFAGTVWYQGESNVGRRNQYASLLETMIANWREDFGAPDMPFYIVELADYLPYSDKGGRAAWADMRIQQAKVAEETDNAYLIKNSDLGEWNDIHPLDKKTLGARVADKVMYHSNKK